MLNYKIEIAALEDKLKELKDKQSELERNCKHEWDNTFYNPETKIELRKNPHSSPGSFDVDRHEITIDRWTRVCKKCGREEHTTEKVVAEYKPVFS